MSYDYFKSGDEFVLNSEQMVNTMKEISSPLMESTKISNFSYLKFCKNGELVNLTTDIDFIKYRFKEKIKYQILFEQELKNSRLNEPYMYLWPQDQASMILKALANQGIGNGCNIFIRKNDAIEVYSFASDIYSVNMQSFYANNLNILKGFILDFKNKIEGTIDNRLKLKVDLNFPVAKYSDSKIKVNTYFDYFDIKKPRKINIDDTVYLTMKEIECCFHLMKGCTIKEIAMNVNLSPRTAETHINSVKFKSNCLNKSELLAYLYLNKWIFNSLFYK